MSEGLRLRQALQAGVARQDRDELALVLYARMLSRRPVWVDSPAGQMTWIQMIGLDDDGELIAYDHEGSDRRCEDYLLANPHRSVEGEEGGERD